MDSLILITSSVSAVSAIWHIKTIYKVICFKVIRCVIFSKGKLYFSHNHNCLQCNTSYKSNFKEACTYLLRKQSWYSSGQRDCSSFTHVKRVQNVGIQCGVVVIWDVMRILYDYIKIDDGLKGELSHNQHLVKENGRR